MTPPLNLGHIVWDRFGCLEPCPEDWREAVPYWEDYTATFFRSTGREYRVADSNVKAWLEAGDRAPFVRMADVLLSRLSQRAATNDVDFVLLAHWLPDLHLGTSVTNFAMHQLGLRGAFGFSISDRGLSAPFFAFECIDRYVRDGRGKALLMVMDQKHLLYQSALIESLSPDNSACIMLLERRSGPGLMYLGYRRQRAAGSGSMSAPCCAMLESLALRSGRTTIITSDPLLMSVTVPADIVPADPHLVCAAPFVALAERMVPDRDYLLLTRDGDCLCGVGFRNGEA
jgi:hypothetical protein